MAALICRHDVATLRIKNSSNEIIDPPNIGVDTLFVHFSAILAELCSDNRFSIMVALICITMVDGTA